MVQKRVLHLRSLVSSRFVSLVLVYTLGEHAILDFKIFVNSYHGGSLQVKSGAPVFLLLFAFAFK